MSDNTTRSFGDTVAQTVSEEEFWNRKFDDEPPPVPRGVFHARPPSRFQRVLDRLHDWRSDTRFGVAALVAVAVIAGVVWYRIGVGGGASARSVAAPASSRVSPSTPTTRAEATPPTTTTSTNRSTGHPITVHVAGAVARPGVVVLPGGSRVIDAVEAVGGAPPDADLDRLNLAAKLVDGERVFVPKVGQADPGVASDGGATGDGSAGSAAPGGKLDLNTATEAQLEGLPGIGPTFAQAIIAERERRGGFRSVNDLRSVHGIGDKRFAQIAPLVTV